ncbi:MAG TPA: DUF2079 domain-containing protein [Thermoplasmata archaeon]|nr:DUF2079 domain-containing protein [Thermoplasmata archaeon]
MSRGERSGGGRGHRLGAVVRSYRVPLAMAAAYTLVIGSLSTYRYFIGQTYAWDLGIMQQALYSAAFHGRLFYYTPELFNKNPSGSYFGVHCSLLMFPLAAFYRLFPSAPALLFLQAFVVAVAALPLVRLCRALECPYPSLFAALYLLSPLTLLSNLYDFHLEAFVPLGEFLLLLALVRRNTLWTIVASLYLFSVYEYGPVFVVCGLGVYALLRFRDLRGLWRSAGVRALLGSRTVLLAAALAVASGVAYLISFSVIYAVNPTLRELNGAFSPSRLSLSVTNFSATGPWVLLLFFGLPFLLLAFLPLFDPRPLLLAAPFALPALFSAVSYYYLGYEYGFLVVPGYILAAALGFRRAEAKRLPHLSRRLVRPVLASASAASLVVIVVVASTTSYGAWFGAGALIGGPTPSNSAAYDLVGSVPPGASILVDDNAFPWVANNLNAYVLPLDIQPSPTTFYEAVNETLHVDPQYIVLNTVQYGLFPYFDNLSGFLDANYAPLAENAGVLLLAWHYAGPMTFYGGYTLSFPGADFPPRHSATDIAYWHGPFTEIIPGEYSWTVQYHASSSGSVLVEVTAGDGHVLLAAGTVHVTATGSGGPRSFTFAFHSNHPYDGVELVPLTTAGLALTTVGATLTEVSP